MSTPLNGAMPGVANSAAAAASKSWRQRGLMIILALTLAATAWVARREQEEGAREASPASAARALPAAAVNASGSETSPARAGSWPPALQPLAANGWPDAELQVLQSWGLSAAPPVASAPMQAKPVPQVEAEPEPPAAPPLGYQLVGRMDEAQRPRIVLSNNLRTVVLAVGETLDQQWRLDAIGPSGAQFTWLAGGQKQSLAYP